MSTFVLIHGAWHGAWCWYRIVSRLERAGHRVIAPDLLGAGRDRTPLASVTLASWREQIGALLVAEREPVVLVGHSRGGVVISEVAEHYPEKVRKLVYLAAFLLRDGESLNQLSANATDSLATASIVPGADGVSCSLRPEGLKDAFYGMCGDEDVALARLCLTPEPLTALVTPVKVSEQRFGRVPRVYVRCLQDRAATLSMQNHMIEASPCEEVITLEADHSPFFSRPDQLARELARL